MPLRGSLRGRLADRGSTLACNTYGSKPVTNALGLGKGGDTIETLRSGFIDTVRNADLNITVAIDRTRNGTQTKSRSRTTGLRGGSDLRSGLDTPLSLMLGVAVLLEVI